MRGSINTRLPPALRALALSAALISTPVALGGCGDTDSDQIKGQVHDLAVAAAAGDYARICDRILAPSLVAHLVSNGIPCAEAMRLAFSEVHDPTVSVGRVIIRGSRAWAITLTTARGQRAEVVAIALRKTGEGWRITSLASPLSAVQKR